MKKRIFLTTICCSLFCLSSMAQDRHDVTVRLETTYGDIRIRLFDDTPNHRDNFIKNVEDGMYDGVLFHRIIRNFMVQTGNPDTRVGDFKKVEPEDTTQMGPSIPAEIKFPEHYHVKGMVAAAREGDEINPEKRSSQYQFYIVTGRNLTRNHMMIFEQERKEVAMELRFNDKLDEHEAEIAELYKQHKPEKVARLRKELHDAAVDEVDANYTPFFPKEVAKAYTYNEGTPWLDGDYTIFGEVIDGMKIVSKIEKAKTNKEDAPLEDIRIIKAVIE